MRVIRSKYIGEHFQTLLDQRRLFYKEESLPFSKVWQRPIAEKWSIGETLYHLILMCRFFRRVSVIYIPVMHPIARIRSDKKYETSTYDIYKEFNQTKKRSMKAPFVIVPPKDIAGKYTFEELKVMLDNETDKLIQLIAKISDPIAGNVYYFDPVAHNPNLIQSIHLLAIHEKHHFDLTKHYFESKAVNQREKALEDNRPITKK